MAAEFVQRGRTFVEQGQLQDAVRVCRLGLLGNPNEIEGRLVLGSALLALSRFDEVLAEMGSALLLQPRNPSALALKGDALLRKGDPQQSIEFLRKAAEASPGDPYVEGLQAEAEAAIAAGFKPSETMELDPEDDGISLIEEPTILSPEFITGSEIELLDEDLVMEEVSGPFERPTEVAPEPMMMDVSPLQNGLPRPSHLGMEAPLNLDDEEVGEPFLPDVPQAQESALPSFDYAEEVERSSFSSQNYSVIESEEPVRPGRPATIGTLFPSDEEEMPTLAKNAALPDPDEVRPAFLNPPVPSSRPSPSARISSPPISLPPVSQGNAGGRSNTADMDLIRGAAESEKVSRQQARSQKRTAAKKKSRFPIYAWVAIGGIALAGGGYGGGQIRELRLQKQVETLQIKARKYSQSGTYLGASQARDLYYRIAKEVPTDATLAALARSQAGLVAEFGENPADAVTTLSKVGDRTLLDALVSDTYLSIASGDQALTLKSAKTISENYSEDPIGYYLLGWAQLSADEADEATTAINKAIERGASPLAFVILARAEALRGRFSEALEAIGKATQMAPKHPGAIIWQARILLESGSLPDNPSDPDDLLAAFAVAARNPKNSQHSLSRAQGAWAGLVLTQIKLERGDMPAAKKALAEARIGHPKDWMFSEMLLHVLLRLGDLDSAKAEAEDAASAWPTLDMPKIISAQVSMRQGRPDEAMKIIADIKSVDSSAPALTIRGQILLAQGEVENAATDLDKALSLRPQFVDAGIARAKVDILRGNARAAISRLEPMYDATATTELAVAYATALRVGGKKDFARTILSPIIEESPTIAALLELAALERSEGRLDEAARVLESAIALNSNSEEARLGAALLEMDEGKILEARKELEALLDSGTTNGVVLLETARVKIMTGDIAGAKAILNRPAAKAGWLNWRVARTNGRIFLTTQKPVEAVSELQRAQSLRPNDHETRLLLMEAYFEFRNKRGSASALKDIKKSFGESTTFAIAQGIHFLLNEKTADALEALFRAKALQEKSNASNLERSRVAYWIGRSYEASVDSVRAKKWLQTAANLNLAQSDAYYWLGQVQYMEQQTKGMVASYEKAVAINPGRNPLAWYFLGTHYASLKRKPAAVIALENFLKYYPDETGDFVTEAKKLLAEIR